jgi:G:T-mismatch repair DNA endonuclease (very short patch repair protein)/endogenous inhibitor of DNA gyrase (YacG/DUF329 family)
MGKRINRECPNCGRTYEADEVRLAHGRQTTCSRECSYAYRAKLVTKAENITCPICSRVFTRSPSQVRAKYSVGFCSAKCHYQARSKGLSTRTVSTPYKVSEAGRAAWREGAKKTHAKRLKEGTYKHSEETKELMRERTTLAISEGRINRVSKLEHRVAGALDTLGISYERQVAIRDSVTGKFVASLDFVLENEFAFEVNGTFWHADPRFYDQAKLAPAQLRSLSKWDKKLELLEALEMPLIVLWESDFNSNPTASLVALLRPVGLLP